MTSPHLTTEGHPDSAQERTNAHIAGATSILALGNIASRVLGLAREMVLTFMFGASAVVDAFQVATIVIRAIYDLLIGGHVNGALIPVLSEIITLKGREELWRVVSLLMSLITTVLIALTVAIIAFAPSIVQITASGASPETLQTATALLRMTAPALIFMGVFAILSGTLYALKQFTMPAFAGAIFNGSIVFFTLFFTPMLQVLLVPASTYSPETYLRPIVIARPNDSITVVAVGWLVGATAQMLIQFIELRRAKLRFTFNWSHPALKSIALLYAPVMLSLVMDTLIIRPFSYNLASQTGDGSIAYMNWATTLIQFPQGLVATAISVAILPTLAGQAVEKGKEAQRAFKDTLGMGIRLAITLIIPATIGLFVLAEPIIEMLFEHGAFTHKDTLITAQALRWYLIGLPFAAVDLLLVYAFYARKDTLTPTLIGIISLIAYMGIAVLLLSSTGLYSLMIADSLKHVVHALISAVLLHRAIIGFGNQRLLMSITKTTVASIGMGITAWGVTPFFVNWIGSYGIVRELIIFSLTATVSGIVFVGLAYLLNIQELRWIASLLMRRLFKRVVNR